MLALVFYKRMIVICVVMQWTNVSYAVTSIDDLTGHVDEKLRYF